MITQDELLAVEGLVAFWGFQEESGRNRVSLGKVPYALEEGNGLITRVEEGVWGPYSAQMGPGKWFQIPREKVGGLDIHGKDAEVTVIAWIKRDIKPKPGCEAVAGLWNETRCKRQYCLFLDLGIWDSRDQVGGHISGVGGPTEGYPYCMDAAIGETRVPVQQWQCAGFTYNGTWCKAYLNGVLDAREGRNPDYYDKGLFDGGIDGSDFTVGAVDRSGEMGNWYYGLLGGLAVFNRALTSAEMEKIGELT